MGKCLWGDARISSSMLNVGLNAGIEVSRLNTEPSHVSDSHFRARFGKGTMRPR